MFRLAPQSSLLSVVLILLVVLFVATHVTPWLVTASAESGSLSITGEGDTVPDDVPGDDPPTTEGDPDEPENHDLKIDIEIKLLSWLTMILNS